MRFLRGQARRDGGGILGLLQMAAAPGRASPDRREQK